MELYNYTMGEVMQIENLKDYITIGRALKPKNNLNLKPIDDFSFGKVKEAQEVYRLNDFEQLTKLFIELHGITDVDFINMKVFDFFYQFNHMKIEIERTITREMNFLNSPPTTKQIGAGVEELYKFGVFSTIYHLAGGDPLKYEQIEAMPYGVIFTTLYYKKELAEYEERLLRVK